MATAAAAAQGPVVFTECDDGGAEVFEARRVLALTVPPTIAAAAICRKSRLAW